MPVSKITAWSYSRLAQYEFCPLQFKLQNIDKIPRPQSPAMKRGNDIHAGVAAFVNNKADTLPQDAMQHPVMVTLMQEVRDIPADNKVVEQQWGFTSDWEACGWFGNTTWFRSVLDVGVLYDDGAMEDVDWKTGKKYGSNTEQMETQALAVMCKYSFVKHVTTRLAYLDVGEFEFGEFSKHDRPRLAQKWGERARKMLTAEAFPPRPNDKCRFCDYSRSKGGQCAFG